MRPRGCAARGSWKKGDRSGHGVDERAQGVVEGLHYLGGGLDGEAAGLDVHQRSGEIGGVAAAGRGDLCGVAAHVGVAFSYADVRGASRVRQVYGAPLGTRTPVLAVRGRCPRPLDEGSRKRVAARREKRILYAASRSRQAKEVVSHCTRWKVAPLTQVPALSRVRNMRYRGPISAPMP